MIRLVTSRDIAQIATIYNHYVLHTAISFELKEVANEEMERRMGEIMQTAPYLVYIDNNDRVLGYCYAHPWKERPAYFQTYETTVYVHPNHCHEGIGMALMTRLIEECKQRPIHALVACITAGNDASISLHEKLGFVKVSHFREVGFKLGTLLDVVDYELILNNDSK